MNSQTIARFFFVALLIVVIEGTAAAQTKSRGWTRGEWDGTGYQVDDKSTWPMHLTVRGRRFSIEYPSLNCGGKWKLISMTRSRARFREVLTHGQDKCANNGNVVLQRLGRNQLLFLYSYEKTREVSASAVLNRRLDVSVNDFRSRRFP